MKKAILGILLTIMAIVLVGCAKTTATDTFRFESRDIEVYVGEQKRLGIIMGNLDTESEIIYHMDAVSNDLGDSEIPASRMLMLNGADSTYYYRDTTRGKNETLTVVGKIPGVVKITAYIKNNPNITDTVNVHIINAKLNAYKINAPKVALNVGETISLSTVTYPDEIPSDAIYYSENEDIIDVTKNGSATAVKPGTALICAKSVYDNSIIAKISITVIDTVLQKIETEKEEYEVKVGKTVDLGIKFIPNKPSANLIFNVADKEVVSVDENGVVTGLKGGSSNIVIACAGKTVTVKVNVIETYALETGFNVKEKQSEYNAKVGDQIVLNYTVLPENAVQLAIAETSNPDVATVDVVNNVATISVVDAGVAEIKLMSPTKMFVRTYTITAEYAVATEIKADPTSVTVQVGAEQEVKLSVEPLNAKQEVEISIVSGADLFTALLSEADGKYEIKVTGIALGEGKIKVTTIDGTVELEIAVTISE